MLSSGSKDEVKGSNELLPSSLPSYFTSSSPSSLASPSLAAPPSMGAMHLSQTGVGMATPGLYMESKVEALKRIAKAPTVAEVAATGGVGGGGGGNEEGRSNSSRWGVFSVRVRGDFVFPVFGFGVVFFSMFCQRSFTNHQPPPIFVHTTKSCLSENYHRSLTPFHRMRRLTALFSLDGQPIRKSQH